MAKKKATKKKACCPTCGGEMAQPVFELPEEESYSIYAFREGMWDLEESAANKEEAAHYAKEPGASGEWVAVWSNHDGEVVWGPEWVPGEDE
jgi:hypothetical protein